MKPIRLLFVACALALAVPFSATVTGCASQTTLEAGGAYSDATLAKTDRAILDASHTLTAFLDWQTANSAYLAKWPEVGALAAKVAAQKDKWIFDAYAARDIYADAAKAYRDGKAAAPNGNAVNAALSVLTNVTAQILAYQTSHPHA